MIYLKKGKMMKKINQDVCKFLERLKEMENDKKLYIYGAGTYGKIFGTFFNKEGLIWKGFIDKNKQIINKKICGKKIYTLAEINKDDCFILISLSCLVYKDVVKSIYHQLEEVGISNKNILYCGDNFELINDIILSINDSEEYLVRNKRLLNIYQGKRCFIIGNGPSLKISDLEKIAKEISLACNGVVDLYKYTDYRPTCFFCEDSLFIRDHIDKIEDLENMLNNCKYLFTTLKNDLNIKYGLKYDKLFYLYAKRTNEIRFSDDICSEIYSAGTTLYTMFQVAIYMGIKEIYLLGVDFNFNKEVLENGKIKINSDVKNHMKLMNENEEGVYNIQMIYKGYECVKKYAETHGIKIYNATRGGKLEVFERVDFDSLFEK